MASFTFEQLKTTYENFAHPISVVRINGADIAKSEGGLSVSDLEVDMTSGFEASMATFWIFHCYDREKGQFQFEKLKKYIFMGSSVMIALGYGARVREVFRGFITRVNFSFRDGQMPGVEITAMDIKGVMMAGNYSRQLKASYFSDGVREILQKTAYSKFQQETMITKLDIDDTPDKAAAGGTSQGQKVSDRTIEMVCESDYEFVVKAAKKYNYEFFSVGGQVYFRKAKCNKEVLYEGAPGKGLKGYDISYDFTGLVETVEVRGMDVGKARLISSQKKFQNKISQGNKAKPFLKQSQKVYLDATVSSKEEAGYRAEYLAEDISYRLGTLKAEFIGLPELIPGRFLKMQDLGTAVSNTFYLMNVRHLMDSEQGYVTRVTGKAAAMENHSPSI